MPVQNQESHESFNEEMYLRQNYEYDEHDQAEDQLRLKSQQQSLVSFAKKRHRQNVTSSKRLANKRANNHSMTQTQLVEQPCILHNKPALNLKRLTNRPSSAVMMRTPAAATAATTVQSSNTTTHQMDHLSLARQGSNMHLASLVTTQRPRRHSDAAYPKKQ